MKTNKVKELYRRYSSLETEILDAISKSKNDKNALEDFKELASQMILGADMIADVAKDPSAHIPTPTY